MRCGCLRSHRNKHSPLEQRTLWEIVNTGQYKRCLRGCEFAEDALIEQALKAAMSVADPHAPGRRARYENLDGLVRQYFPRSRDFNTITAE